MSFLTKIRELRVAAERYHGNSRRLKALPLASIVIVVVLVLVNVVVWAAAGVVLHYEPGFASTALLAYTLGLRHALDADHISAIDLMTRRLVAAGQKPATVGTYFSLGHSTIVIITSILVAASAEAISKRFDSFSQIGGIVGSSVSAAFLIVLGLMNAYILFKLVHKLQELTRTGPGAETGLEFQGGGVLFRCFRFMFKFINRPWKMYPLGVMFGLGFDTSSEVALLGIASIQGSKGTSLWLILVFPVLFTEYASSASEIEIGVPKTVPGADRAAAGMCLLDTLDSALMLALYSSTSLAQDPIAILYYSIILTGLTVVVAIVIGVIQLLTLIDNAASPSGLFWEGVERAGDHYDIIGGCVCASFVLVGAMAVLFYRPWRRSIDAIRNVPSVVLGNGGHEGQQHGEHASKHATV